MIRRPPSSTRTDALFPYTTLFRSGEADLAADRVAQVDLTLDLIEPVRAVRVLEVRHVRVGARVERIDDHLALDRTGDFGAADFQRLRQRRDLPVAFAHARSEEHTSELQSLMRSSYAISCLKKKTRTSNLHLP